MTMASISVSLSVSLSSLIEGRETSFQAVSSPKERPTWQETVVSAA